MYAATHPYTIDENGKRKYVYRHWGIVNENKKCIPEKRYVFASLEERAKLVFPDDWDMSEVKRLSGAKQPGCPAYIDSGKSRRLLKEFEVYVEAKKVKNARLEALRAGFKECYKNHDFATIVSVGNKLPEELLTTDEVLLRFYDIASSRV